VQAHNIKLVIINVTIPGSPSRRKLNFPIKLIKSKDPLHEKNLPLVVIKVSEAACCQGA
jgi:hypothetical protein